MTENPHPTVWETVWKNLNWDDDERRQTAERERLRQRAQQYATQDREVEGAESNRVVLVFDLGSEHYGVDVMLIRGVRKITRITPVPGTPAFYRGVTNLRGRLITVMDLRRFFNITVAEDEDAPEELVIVRAYNLEIGLLAHQVSGVLTIPTSAIKPAEHMPYALGLTNQRIILLNVVQLLEDQRLIVGERENGGAS